MVSTRFQSALPIFRGSGRLRETGEMLRGGQPPARGFFSLGVYAAFFFLNFFGAFRYLHARWQLESRVDLSQISAGRFVLACLAPFWLQ